MEDIKVDSVEEKANSPQDIIIAPHNLTIKYGILPRFAEEDAK